MLSTTEGAEPQFRILLEEPGWMAVVKPCRLLVHRTDIDFHEKFNLRDLINKTRNQEEWLQPVHRLDKPTSGIVLMATKGDILNALKLEFVHRRTQKTYFAIVRGWTEDEGVVDKPLPTAHSDKPKEAQTRYKTLARCVVNHPVGPYETARYSLVECKPSTGRFHQIRLHFRHLRHPILGDSRYGDKAHNRFVSRQFEVDTLMLHAGHLVVKHPEKDCALSLTARVGEAWEKLLNAWEWDNNLDMVPRLDSVQETSSGGD